LPTIKNKTIKNEELKQQLLDEYISARKKIKRLILLVLIAGLAIAIISYFN